MHVNCLRARISKTEYIILFFSILISPQCALFVGSYSGLQLNPLYNWMVSETLVLFVCTGKDLRDQINGPSRSSALRALSLGKHHYLYPQGQGSLGEGSYSHSHNHTRVSQLTHPCIQTAFLGSFSIRASSRSRDPRSHQRAPSGYHRKSPI